MKRCPYCRAVVKTEEDLAEHMFECDQAAQNLAEDNELEAETLSDQDEG